MSSASIILILLQIIFVQLRSHFIIFSVAYSALRLLSESIEILEKCSHGAAGKRCKLDDLAAVVEREADDIWIVHLA